MDVREYATQDLMKSFNSMRESSPLLPVYANELRSRKASDMTCCYVPQRGKSRQQCTDRATVYYGFCDRHKNTLLAKRVRDRFNHALEQFDEQAQQQKQINSLLTDDAQRELTPPPTPPPTPDYREPVRVVESEDDESEDDESEVHETVYPDDDCEDDERPATPTEAMTSDDESSEEICDYKSNPNTYEDDESVQLKVHRNTWGNFEHKQTGFVFDIAKKHVYGVQHKDGKVVPLGPREQAFCRLHHWPYV